MHLEGLADACDGLFGGRTLEDRLAIMRDPRVGAYGVMGLTSVLGLKWAGVGSLPGDVRFEGLLLAPCLARAGLAVCVIAFPYARKEGMGAPLRSAGLRQAIAASGVAAAVAGALLGAGGIAAWALAMAGALALGTWASQRAGGLTGDIYGGITEVVETATLLGLAAAGARGWLVPLALG
jgi:adenosylcobinamide-GDP ribazoletransferase